MVSIARSTSIDDDTRQASLEFLTLLIENSPIMIRSLPSTVLLIPLLHILFSILVAIDDDPLWEQDETEPEENEPTLFNYALDVLGRVSQALRGRVFLPPLYSLMDESIHSEDWRRRHAVMYTLCQVGEIITDASQRQQICNYVITSFQDSHPRVRYASVRCLGQLATDFQPFLQQELPVSALNAIFSLLRVDQPVRVRFITAAALINFVDGADASILQPILGTMLAALVSALQTSPILVQKQVRFVEFYERIDSSCHRIDRRLCRRVVCTVLFVCDAHYQTTVYASSRSSESSIDQHRSILLPVDSS